MGAKGESPRAGGDGLPASGGEGGKDVCSSLPLSVAPPLEAQPSPPPAKPAPPRRKGPRPKHMPRRMCVVCRDHDAKRALHRIVRTPEGVVEPDPTGRRNGRGAYLCSREACWEKALTSGLLARALNVEIEKETIDALRRHAATLSLETAGAGAARDTGGER